ncbi:hypothetical protein E2C01_045997 [Portunus trituberculatus]|uniref:Uncharacterized protein n=1 Tax=Portunus trituberculatus TaxID=210409 RepID=A0A5B7G2V8_PORTR|nr:hypothetical protein [Portunus trituberculatus]
MEKAEGEEGEENGVEEVGVEVEGDRDVEWYSLNKLNLLLYDLLVSSLTSSGVVVFLEYVPAAVDASRGLELEDTLFLLSSLLFDMIDKRNQSCKSHLAAGCPSSLNRQAPICRPLAWRSSSQVFFPSCVSSAQ